MLARFDFGADQAAWLFRAPERVVVARTVAEVPACMAAVEEALQDGLYAAGYVAYEAAPAFDSALKTHAPSSLPLACFGLFRSVDRDSHLQATPPPPSAVWVPALSASDHASGVAAIREAIADGDTYQINYTFRLRATIDAAHVPSLYRHLSRAEQVPYAAYLDLGDWQILSLSPELFFHLHGRRIVTRPMKGTAPRGRWAEEDAARGEGLRQSEKNRAENIMIVDLCRNDLSRICEVGSVQASSLCKIEAYPTVWQMVSTVEGDVKAGTRLSDIFGALFPAGSITGAPKSSSMRLIASLEHAPRGIYCGAIGFATPDGRATFNVAIRTMTVTARSGEAEYGVGGGVTWDSIAADEHAEALSKAACLEGRPPFALIETMRFEDGALIRVDRHLSRLAESAAFFAFAFDKLEVRARLDAHLYSSRPGQRLRVRLLLHESGDAEIESHDFEETAKGSLPIDLADTPVNSEDRFLCHKTTRRHVYEQRRTEHADAFDVLLWNERRELTEFTRGNVVVELDGALWTPTRASGLLAGVFLGELLDAGIVHERVLVVDDLLRCTRLWFVNSLREWVPVHLAKER